MSRTNKRSIHRGLNIKHETSVNLKDQAKLQKLGLEKKYFGRELKSIRLLFLNRVFEGVGIKNINGGWEVFCENLNTFIDEKFKCENGDCISSWRLKCSIPLLTFYDENFLNNKNTENIIRHQVVTIGNVGITFFPKIKGCRSNKCLLFLTFLDYMSFKSLEKDFHIETNNYDCIIMNSITNFPTMLLDSENYEHVYCFFSNDVAGITMRKTMEQRNPHRVLDMQQYYQGYHSLFDCLTRKKNSLKNYK